MTREFIYTVKFDKKWKDAGLDDDDLRLFEIFLLENPAAGKIMEGTGGLRKVRWALPSAGKSGGIRALYIDFLMVEKIIAIDLFSKDEKENLTKSERNNIKKVVKSIGEEIER